MSEPTGMPRPGDLAPEFVLPDVHGTPVSLAALRGTPVALVFLPFAFSRVCGSEVQALRDNIADFESAGVRLLGVTCDTVFALRLWAESEGLGFDLLSDFWPHGAAAGAYGVFDAEAGVPRRGNFLIDGDGLVRWRTLSPPGTARDLGEYRAALAAL